MLGRAPRSKGASAGKRPHEARHAASYGRLLYVPDHGGDLRNADRRAAAGLLDLHGHCRGDRGLGRPARAPVLSSRGAGCANLAAPNAPEDVSAWQGSMGGRSDVGWWDG